MKEIVFRVRKDEEGYYEAIPKHEKIGGGTGASDYNTLKDKIKEFVSLILSDGFYKEANLPKNPQIRLIYSELLFENPEAKKILVIGNLEKIGYRAKCDSYVDLDLYHKNLEELKRMISQQIRDAGHYDKHVEFRLEEVL